MVAADHAGRYVLINPEFHENENYYKTHFKYINLISFYSYLYLEVATWSAAHPEGTALPCNCIIKNNAAMSMTLKLITNI